MKSIIFILLITLIVSCSTDTKMQLPNDANSLKQFFESNKNVKKLKFKNETENKLEQRLNACEQWAQQTYGQPNGSQNLWYTNHDCCFSQVYANGGQCNITLTWYARNCFGNNYNFHFWIFNQYHQTIGYGQMPASECYQTGFNYTYIPISSIPVQTSGYYSMMWVVGNEQGQFCRLENINNIYVSIPATGCQEP